MNAKTTDGQRNWDREKRAELLSTASPFRSLAPALLDEVAGLLRPDRYVRGEFVLAEGLPASRFHVLGEGRVKVMRGDEEGREVILRLIGPGDIFGSDGLWGGEAYELSALAVQDSVVLRMLVGKGAALMEAHPEFAAALVREFGRRLREDDERILDLQTARAQARIARMLLQVADQMGVDGEGGRELGIRLTRRDIAEMAGVTEGTVSRSLSGWERRGIVEAGRERVAILLRDELQAAAEDAPLEEDG